MGFLRDKSMNEKILHTFFLQSSYTHSELLHKVGVVKEFLEFVFFTKNQSCADEALIERWEDEGSVEQKDMVLLRSFHEDFWKLFSRDFFYEILDSVSEDVKKLPVLPITVPVDLPEQNIIGIGKWVRSEIDKQMLLDVDIDQSLSVGCQFVWKDKLHDFSLSHFFNRQQKEIHQILHSQIKKVQKSR